MIDHYNHKTMHYRTKDHNKRGLTGVKALLLLMFMLCTGVSNGQNIIVNLALLDGIDITPENVFNFQVMNNTGRSFPAKMQGRLHYRNSTLRFSYSFNTTLQAGLNNFSKDRVSSPAWTFSDNALRELFFNYGKLPQGMYEYCVEVLPEGTGGEVIPPNDADACLYNTSNDIFLINLIDPENDAKIYETNPMLSWVVNYPFASELTYRLRIAELKEGQNNENAITRNNPVYQDNHVLGTTATYPVTARPLEKWQPYVWTVDAYYKGILLGGAEVWKFTIIDDSLLAHIPKDLSYIDVSLEKGNSFSYAIGKLKLKYILKDLKVDSVKILIQDESGRTISTKNNELVSVSGDNRFVLDLYETGKFRHLKKYSLRFASNTGAVYTIKFIYVNPDFLDK